MDKKPHQNVFKLKFSIVQHKVRGRGSTFKLFLGIVVLHYAQNKFP